MCPPALYGHGLERIVELGAAIRADAICPSRDGEDTAEIGVATAKQKLQQPSERHSSQLLTGAAGSSQFPNAGQMPKPDCD